MAAYVRPYVGGRRPEHKEDIPIIDSPKPITYIEHFINPLSSIPSFPPRSLICVEGKIGSGKTELLKNHFGKDDAYIVMEEPMDKMDAIVKKFYDGSITKEQTSSAITDICLSEMISYMDKAEKEGKSLVVERCPLLRYFLFRYDRSDTIESVRASLHQSMSVSVDKKVWCQDVIKGYMETPTLKSVMIPMMSKYTFESLVYLILDCRDDEVLLHIRRRGRVYEKELKHGYNALLYNSIYKTTETFHDTLVKLIDSGVSYEELIELYV